MIYLYVKKHSVTGLKYFGMTKTSNPFRYNGSGLYWKSHLKVHGKQHVKTIELYGFDDEQLCSDFALKFSRDNNIAESKEWANLKEENGLEGGGSYSEESRSKMREAKLGKSPWNKDKTNVYSEEALMRYSLVNKNKGKIHTDETKLKMSKSKLGILKSEETKINMSKAQNNRSESHLKNLSLANIGHKHSKESRAKMSESRKGKIPWNKGLKFNR